MLIMRLGIRVMLFNTTFNIISVMLWQSVLLVEYPEKTNVLSQVSDKLYQIKLARFEFTTDRH